MFPSPKKLIAMSVFAAFVSGAAASPSSSTAAPKLDGLWVDKWRDDIYLWQEGAKIVGAYSWFGRPAAIIGVIDGDAVALRYYQAAGFNGEARCTITHKGARMRCEYASDNRREGGKWDLIRVGDFTDR